jgi:CRP-like cAMP-binding protein
MGIEDDIALLERVPTFATLGHEALRILAVGAESRSVAEGQVLFRAGEIADCSYIVETGSFRLIPSHPRERPIVVRRGTLLGEYALLTETRRPVTATAQELSSVMRITRPLFLRMLEGYPAVALRMRDGIISRAGNIAVEFSRVREALGDPPPLPESANAQESPPVAAGTPAVASQTGVEEERADATAEPSATEHQQADDNAPTNAAPPSDTETSPAGASDIAPTEGTGEKPPADATDSPKPS